MNLKLYIGGERVNSEKAVDAIPFANGMIPPCGASCDAEEI